MQTSRFNYLFSIDGKRYVFNAVSEAIISLPIDEDLEMTNESATLCRLKMQVASPDNDVVNFQKKVNVITKAFGNVADLNVIVTDRCNLRCPGCFNHQAIQHGDDFPQLLIALKGQLITLCNLYDQNVVKKVSISLSGGEPLLFKERLSLVVEICESFLGNRAHDYLIMTNGILLTKEAIGQLSTWGINDYYISVDSNRYVLSGYKGIRHGRASLRDLCVCAKQIYAATMKKPILRFNIGSTDDTYPINAINELYENGLASVVILDFKRWYNNRKPDVYYKLLPRRIRELILYAHRIGFECMWRWQDNIDKYLACRVDTGFGVSIHPNGEISVCPYTFDDVKVKLQNNKRCETCCFLPICFGGCGCKSHYPHYCDYEMIQEALKTHVLACKLVPKSYCGAM